MVSESHIRSVETQSVDVMSAYILWSTIRGTKVIGVAIGQHSQMLAISCHILGIDLAGIKLSLVRPTYIEAIKHNNETNKR